MELRVVTGLYLMTVIWCISRGLVEGCGSIEILHLSTNDLGLILSTPSYPSYTKWNEQLCWIIRCDAPDTMTVEIKSYDSTSSSDSLSFYDGYSSPSVLIEEVVDLSGYGVHYYEIRGSTSQELFIVFDDPSPNYPHDKRFIMCILIGDNFRKCDYDSGGTTEAPTDASTWTPGAIAGLSFGVLVMVVMGPAIYCCQKNPCDKEGGSCNKKEETAVRAGQSGGTTQQSGQGRSVFDPPVRRPRVLSPIVRPTNVVRPAPLSSVQPGVPSASIQPPERPIPPRTRSPTPPRIPTPTPTPQQNRPDLDPTPPYEPPPAEPPPAYQLGPPPAYPTSPPPYSVSGGAVLPPYPGTGLIPSAPDLPSDSAYPPSSSYPPGVSGPSVPEHDPAYPPRPSTQTLPPKAD